MDRQANRTSRIEEARVVRHKSLGVDSERRGEVEGVQAAQMSAGEKSCLVQQRARWVDEIDSSQQVRYHELIELETHRKSAQLGLEQRTRNDLVPVDGLVEICGKRVGLFFLHEELRRGGRIQISGQRSPRMSSRADWVLTLRLARGICENGRRDLALRIRRRLSGAGGVRRATTSPWLVISYDAPAATSRRISALRLRRSRWANCSVIVASCRGVATVAVWHRLLLEHYALRQSPDEWIIPLFGPADGKRDVREGRVISFLFRSVTRIVLSSVALVAAAAGASDGEVCGSRVDLLGFGGSKGDIGGLDVLGDPFGRPAAGDGHNARRRSAPDAA